VDNHIASVTEAFKTWNLIRDEAVAQAYLVSLLGTKERRQNEPKLPETKTERRRKRHDSEPPAV
jgi:hypothetical protein